jgi:hypothetical protein
MDLPEIFKSSSHPPGRYVPAGIKQLITVCTTVLLNLPDKTIHVKLIELNDRTYVSFSDS